MLTDFMGGFAHREPSTSLFWMALATVLTAAVCCGFVLGITFQTLFESSVVNIYIGMYVCIYICKYMYMQV